MIGLNVRTDALFMDIDGTLLDIAPHYDAVVVPPELVQKLDALNKSMNGAIAFISGRTVENMDALFTPLRLACAGVHGAAWRLRGEDAIQTRERLPESFRHAIEAAFEGDGRVLVEDKLFSLSIHYRLAPEKEEEVVAQAASILAASGLDLAFVNSLKTVEIKPKDFDKGTALRRFMAEPPFAGRRPVFIGDDVSDLLAIAAARALGGFGARVGGESHEGNVFQNPSAVRAWLLQSDA